MSVNPENSNGVAIRQICIEKLDQDILDLDSFQDALVIYRFQGIVVGTSWLPVRKGAIRSDQLQSAVSNIAWPVWMQIIAKMEKSASWQPEATVVVCTRNRTNDLAACLPALARLAKMGHQVLVVDNCPSDDSTARLVANYPEITYIYEVRPGLDIARNRGIMEASGDVVAFIDDDAIPDEEWLESLLSNFDDPMVAVVTGLTLPLELDTQAQQWFEKTNGFTRGFERRSFDSRIMSVLATGRVGAGVNMAIRRNAIGEIGLFDEALDGGTQTLSGGDQEFFYRTLAHGYRIIYEPRALVWHKHRREWKALRHTIMGYGVGLFAWWTKTLIEGQEYSLLYWATLWFIQHHLVNVLRSTFRRPGSIPSDLAWAEFWGALIGPFRYFRSRRALKRQTGLTPDFERPAEEGKQIAISAIRSGVETP